MSGGQKALTTSKIDMSVSIVRFLHFRILEFPLMNMGIYYDILNNIGIQLGFI